MSQPVSAVGSSSDFAGVFVSLVNILGVLVGACIGLFGNKLLNHYSESKRKREKKIEILENIEMCSLKCIDYVLLVNNSNTVTDFFAQAMSFPAPQPNTFNFIKEEYQRWLNLVISSNENLINLKGELAKNYMSFKIYFGKDETLREMLNEIVQPIPLELKTYENILDHKTLRGVRDSNVVLIKEAVLKQLNIKRKKIIDYLDQKIAEIK